MSNPSYLVSVRIVNLDTNEEEVLYEHPIKKRCRFAKEFSHGNYKIYLRLDFEDILDGEPVLDAQFKDKITGKFIKKPRCHHTEMKDDVQAGRKAYKFEYDDLRLRLYIIRTMEKTFSGNAILRKE